jgi:hypothetical protein
VNCCARTLKTSEQVYLKTRKILVVALKLDASTSSGRAGAVGMLYATLQVRLQGAGLVDYYPKVLKGVMSTGCCACGAFCSWVLILGVLVLR